MATRAPAEARKTAVSAPIPRDEPVTRARTPCSDPGAMALFTVHDPINRPLQPTAEHPAEWQDRVLASEHGRRRSHELGLGLLVGPDPGLPSSRDAQPLVRLPHVGRRQPR